MAIFSMVAIVLFVWGIIVFSKNKVRGKNILFGASCCLVFFFLTIPFSGTFSEGTSASQTSTTPETEPVPASSPTVTDPPVSVQVNSNARVDFKSAERIDASKTRLATDYPDNFTMQKTLQDLAVKNQRELEEAINDLTDDEWSKLHGSYNRLVDSYADSPTMVLTLFKKEIASFRGMK